MRANKIHAADILYDTPANAISLHLGYPDPATFPNTALAGAIAAAIRQHPETALQYCGEAGETSLRSTIAGIYARAGMAIDPSCILITQGTTEALSLISQLLIRPGDPVLVESPTYLWALRAFKLQGAHIISIPVSPEGISLAGLEDALAGLRNNGKRARFLYLMPSFQNPTGHRMSREARGALLALAARHELLIFEDDAYGELHFNGQYAPTLYEMDTQETVVSARSFSKTVGPGIRLGWIAWVPQRIQELGQVKQTGACTIMSMAVAAYAASEEYQAALSRNRTLYSHKRNVMGEALAHYLPDDVTWNIPEGGFYFWVRIPPRISLQALCRDLAQKDVHVMDGSGFFLKDGYSALRLSFSYETLDRISAGVTQLGLFFKR